MKSDVLVYKRYLLEAEPAEKQVEWELHADVEVAEFSIACGYFVESHFVDDRFDIDGVFCEQCYAPFVFVEPC